jgi:hypothetical protein
MHKDFDPQKIDWKEMLLLSQQQQRGPPSQWGGGGGASAVFRGAPLQRGMGVGAVFRSLLRFLMPLGREAAVAIGRQGLETGVRTLNDALEGRNLREAALEHGRAGAKQLLNSAKSRIISQTQSGGGGEKHINKIGRYNMTPLTKATHIKNKRPLKTKKSLKNKNSSSSFNKKLRRDALGFY